VEADPVVQVAAAPKQPSVDLVIEITVLELSRKCSNLHALTHLTFVWADTPHPDIGWRLGAIDGFFSPSHHMEA